MEQNTQPVSAEAVVEQMTKRMGAKEKELAMYEVYIVQLQKQVEDLQSALEAYQPE